MVTIEYEVTIVDTFAVGVQFAVEMAVVIWLAVMVTIMVAVGV